MFTIKAFPSTSSPEGTTNLKGDEDDGYTILPYVVLCTVEGICSDSVEVPSFGILFVVFSPTTTRTGISPSFLTTPAIFRFPPKSVNRFCSGISIISEANAFEYTPKRLRVESVKRHNIKTMENDFNNIAILLGNCFSLIRTILNQFNFLYSFTKDIIALVETYNE